MLFFLFQIFRYPAHYLTHYNYWVLEASSKEQLEEELTELDIPINSNVFVALGDFSTHKLEVYDMYRPMPGMTIRCTYMKYSYINLVLIECHSGGCG